MTGGRSHWGAGMAGLLAWRNLAHDRSRFVVTLVGIIFAVVLIAMQMGLFLGFSDSTTTIINHTRADFWIVGKGSQNFEVTLPISERELYLARSVPGVAQAEALLVQFMLWKKPDGGNESIILLGSDLNTGLAGPWHIVEGRLEDLRRPDAVMTDRVYMDKLGVGRVGTQVEINNRRALLVGVTQGIRSFTTSPWVFASYRSAQHLSGFADDKTNYVIGRLRPDADPTQVRDALARILPRTDVYLSADFAARTRDYWMFTTGAGASVLMSAVLGLLVGVVIVAQVLYATTVDHLPEFGTLRAMGAPRAFIYKVILSQAVISATLGGLPGIAVSLMIAKGSEFSAAAILVPPRWTVVLYVITLVMCILASVASIRKAMSIDPAMVFQR
ncbi:ABC transporter permease [uncultured Thiodictyon sp.]|uniref:ABC transporter permease n=1 Tax=uncultured Thiodictyon sp. TaxID=1846217 RepID=UPI0025CBA01F|nr:ABC transporter permease [uncultured Thiodictyon sp.]